MKTETFHNTAHTLQIMLKISRDGKKPTRTGEETRAPRGNPEAWGEHSNAMHRVARQIC